MSTRGVTTRGGRPRKPLDQHLRDGTYRRDRHGPLGPDRLDWRPKPPAKIAASLKSQRRWIRSAADEHAFRSGCRFNERLAKHAADFFPAFLCHSKGEWAGQPFTLTDWQLAEIVYPLFGWVRPDGTRRFRRSYIEIPKKNYKSTMASGIGLYMTCGDYEPGAEVYSLGADRDQARVVHNEAINMVEASPKLKQVLKINRTSGAISYNATRSTYRVLSGAPRGKHGINIHCGIADELHEWYGTDLWDAIKYGYRARRNPLQFVITNAGNDTESVCYKQRQKAESIIAGTTFDDGFFALICCVSREEAEAEVAAVRSGTTELAVAASCNPGFGHIIQPDTLLSDIQDAIQTPSELPNLLRLTYGVWVVGAEPWLDYQQWQDCEEQYTEDDLLDQPCWLGLDLSITRDMTAVVAIFPDEDGGYRQLAYHWLPEETIRRDRKVIDYFEWVEDGHLFAVPGSVIEQDAIEQFISEHLASQFDVQGIVYDPMYAEGITQRLEEEHGIPRVKFPQTIMHFAGPTAAYERLVISGDLHHNNNPVLTWQAQHVSIRTDVNNNKRPVKPKSEEVRKIDGIVAGIMALSQAMEAEGGSAYDAEEVDLLYV